MSSLAHLLVGVQPENRMVIVLWMWGAKGLQVSLPVVYTELSLLARARSLGLSFFVTLLAYTPLSKCHSFRWAPASGLLANLVLAEKFNNIISA